MLAVSNISPHPLTQFGNAHLYLALETVVSVSKSHNSNIERLG